MKKQRKVPESGLCHICKREAGYSPRDNGVHTAQVKKCSGCGEVRAISPDRHWTR